MRHAATSATTSPASIAMPPSRAVGTEWTSRARTGVTAWSRWASDRARGVLRKVTAAAITITSR